MQKTKKELTDLEKWQLRNVFYLESPESLGVTLEEFNKLKRLLENHSPEEILAKIEKVQKHKLKVSKRNAQTEELAAAGIDCLITPCKENMEVKVELMYPKDNPHSKKSALCKKKSEHKRSGGIQFKEGSPERRYYVPRNKMRTPTCDEEIDMFLYEPLRRSVPVKRPRKCRPQIGVEQSTRPAQAETAPCCSSRVSSDRQYPDVEYHTPPNQRLTPNQGICPMRKPFKSYTSAEEESDKQCLSKYLTDPIQISGNTPVETLWCLPPGTVIKLSVDDETQNVSRGRNSLSRRTSLKKRCSRSFTSLKKRCSRVVYAIICTKPNLEEAE